MADMRGLYSATPTARSVGAGSTLPLPVAVDTYGRIILSPSAIGGTPSWSNTTTGAASAVVKAAPGSLIGFFGANEGAAKRWIFFFNAVTATGAPLIAPLPVLQGAPFSLSVNDPIPFSVGIAWGISSTAGTYTADAAATFSLSAEYL